MEWTNHHSHPGGSLRKICPACHTRTDHIIHPDCVVCNGNGYLALGEGALSLYSPEAVSQAVELGLEAVARVTDMTQTLSDDRAACIRSAIEKMEAAGLLSVEESPYINKAWWSKPKARQPRGEDGKFASFLDAGELAEQIVQEALIPLDLVLKAAAPYEYQVGERPNARGLPVMSASGHPSHLARIADPQEPGRDTNAFVRERELNERRAIILEEAAVKAAQKKLRKVARV